LNDVLKTKILFEISQIDKLLGDSEPLLDLCNIKKPDFIEMSAAALLVHSFYNGIENILMLIFKSFNEELPQGTKWHIELLDKSFISNGERKSIFKKELQETLEEYLKFRHFIRHAYGFQLDWERMEDLVKKVTGIWKNLKEDINIFLKNS
jgi:hypothetical protein